MVGTQKNLVITLVLMATCCQVHILSFSSKLCFVLKQNVFIHQYWEFCGLLILNKWMWTSIVSFTKLVPLPLLELCILAKILLHYTSLFIFFLTFLPLLNLSIFHSIIIFLKYRLNQDTLTSSLYLYRVNLNSLLDI